MLLSIKTKNMLKTYEMNGKKNILIVGANGSGMSVFLNSILNEHPFINGIYSGVIGAQYFYNIISNVKFFKPVTDANRSFNTLHEILFNYNNYSQLAIANHTYSQTFISINKIIQDEISTKYTNFEKKFISNYQQFATKAFSSVSNRGVFSESPENDASLRMKMAIENFLVGKKVVGLSPNGTAVLIMDLDGKTKTLSELSDGEKKIFSLASGLIEIEDNGAVYLWDEPELSFHPSWIRKLLKFLDDLLPNSSLILTTHSPILLQQAIINDSFNVVKLVRNESGVNLVNLEVDKDEDIRREFDLDGIDIFKSLSKKAIFVEGITDKMYLSLLPELRGFDINKSDSISRVKSIIETLKYVKNFHDKVYFIFDNDDNGVFDKLKSTDLIDKDRNISLLHGLEKGQEIEGYFIDIIENDPYLMNMVITSKNIDKYAEGEFTRNRKPINFQTVKAMLGQKKILCGSHISLSEPQVHLLSKNELCNLLIDKHMDEVIMALEPLVDGFLKLVE